MSAPVRYIFSHLGIEFVVYRCSSRLVRRESASLKLIPPIIFADGGDHCRDILSISRARSLRQAIRHSEGENTSIALSGYGFR